MKIFLGKCSWILLFAIAATGCGGPDWDALCGDSEACIGGNDKDVAACVEANEGVAEAMSDIGCEDEYNAYYDCISEFLTCTSESSGLPCSTDSDCGGSAQGGGLCVGSTCTFKSYGPDPARTTDETCRAEERAFSRCN